MSRVFSIPGNSFLSHSLAAYIRNNSVKKPRWNHPASTLFSLRGEKKTKPVNLELPEATNEFPLKWPASVVPQMLAGTMPKADISSFMHLSFLLTWLSGYESDPRIP